MSDRNPWEWERIRLTLAIVAIPIFNYIFQAIVTILLNIKTKHAPGWDDLLDWPSWIACVLSAVLQVVAYIGWSLSHLRHLPAHDAKLDQIIKTQNELRESGTEAVGAATRLIDNALGTSFANLNLLKTHPEEYNDVLDALGFNFRNWFERVDADRRSPAMVSAWLRYIRTYYLEEAFDIKRSEIATNARNFTYLLLDTLEVFRSYCKKANESGRKLKAVHVAVTPVHPKDWYNWPHGHKKPHGYFEEEFLGHFWRCLREVADVPKSKDILDMRRILLAAADDSAVIESKKHLDWPLDLSSSLRQDLTESWILPVCLPPEKVAEDTAPAAPLLSQYYHWLIANAGFTPSGIPIVPFVCKRWSSNLLLDQTIRATLAKLSDAPPTDVLPLIEKAQELHLKEVQGALKQLDDLIKAIPNSNETAKAWVPCKEACESIMAGNRSEVYALILRSQMLDVRLSEHDACDAFAAQEFLRQLVLSVLRLKDALIASRTSLPSLGELFATSLHSSPSGCEVVDLSAKAIQKWDDTGLRNEFHMFGTQEPSSELVWHVAIAADITYPFQVAKIHILEPGHPGHYEGGKAVAGFDQYVTVINGLMKAQPSIFNETLLKHPAWSAP